MATPITIQLPEEMLIEALAQLPPERLSQLLRRVDEMRNPKLVTFPIESLIQLTGIISVGGDALIESEQLYDDLGNLPPSPN